MALRPVVVSEIALVSGNAPLSAAAGRVSVVYLAGDASKSVFSIGAASALVVRVSALGVGAPVVSALDVRAAATAVVRVVSVVGAVVDVSMRLPDDVCYFWIGQSDWAAAVRKARANSYRIHPPPRGMRVARLSSCYDIRHRRARWEMQRKNRRRRKSRSVAIRSRHSELYYPPCVCFIIIRYFKSLLARLKLSISNPADLPIRPPYRYIYLPVC